MSMCLDFTEIAGEFEREQAAWDWECVRATGSWT